MNSAEVMVLPDLLFSLGWRYGEGHLKKCQVCRKRLFYQYGWLSPKYAIYHDKCLANSKRYSKIIKQYQKGTEKLCQKHLK
jgi:hypothetical protein